jgi:short-subunit dehydrogenase
LLVLVAAEGAHVVVSGRDAERGRAVVQEIRAADGRADLVVVDLGASAEAARALAAEGASEISVARRRLKVLDGLRLHADARSPTW